MRTNMLYGGDQAFLNACKHHPTSIEPLEPFSGFMIAFQ